MRKNKSLKQWHLFPCILPILGMALLKQCPLVIVKASLPIMEDQLHGSLYSTPVIRVRTSEPGPGAPDQCLCQLWLL